MYEPNTSIIVDNLSSENCKNDSYEEYEIIKEDYCSSPKCGIKSKIVTKAVEKILFSPLEISTNPYFKYCVTPGKDEHFKFDFSQSETNHTRNQEDKNQKKNINNNSNNQKTSYLDTNKDELKEEKDENGSEIDNEENGNITKYLNIIDKKESDINLNYNDSQNNKTNEIIVDTSNDNEEKKRKLKSRNKNKNKNKKAPLLSDIKNDDENKNNIYNENRNSNHNSIILKDTRKLSFNYMSENYKERKKIKRSQNQKHNLFILNDDNNSNTKNTDSRLFHKNKPKANSIFQSIKLTKETTKNLKKKYHHLELLKIKKNLLK